MTYHEALQIAYNALVEIDRQTPYPIAKHAIQAINRAFNEQPEQEKESTAQTVDPRLLLGRSNNFNKETENRLCDIERRLAAIETQSAPPSKQEPDYGIDRGAWSDVPDATKWVDELRGDDEPEHEPVAYLDAVDNKTAYVAPARKRWLDPQQDKEWKQFHYDHQYDTPLYTAPVSKPWVSLTDEEEIELDEKYGDDFNAYIEARDAALKEKNT